MQTIPNWFNLKRYRNTVPYFNNVKYLVVHIDPQLNLQAQKSYRKKNFKIYWHYFETKLLSPIFAFLKLYYAFVHPHLLNGLIIWRSTYPTYQKNLSVLQNKAVWLLGGRPIETTLLLFIQLSKY